MLTMRPIWDYRYKLGILRFQVGVPARWVQPRETGNMAMKTVEMTVAGTILTIKVDLSKEFGLSSSKKSIIIDSTEGKVSIPNREEKLDMNVYRTK